MTELLIDHVSVDVQGNRLLDDFALSVGNADVVAIVGPNGAGKTTLLRCILGLLRPTKGSILFERTHSSALSAKERAAIVAHLAQHTTRDDLLTAVEYVAAARFRYDESRRASERVAHVALERVDADNLAARQLGTLSGGEQQRVAFAALLAQEAKILLLDEPANHLDPARQAVTYALLGELQRSGSTMLIVTHDVNLLAHVTQPERVRVVGMKNGRNCFDLPYRADGLCDSLAELYGVPMRQFQDHDHVLIVPALTRHP